MDLHRLLAENMLRFGTKNLSNQLKAKLREQTDTAANTTTDTTTTNKSTVTQTINTDQSKVTEYPAAYITTDATALQRLGTNKARIAAAAKKNVNAAAIEDQLIKTPGYTEFIQHLSMDSNSESANIWYLKLTQDSRIKFLKQFNEDLTTIKSKLKKGKQYEVSLRNKGTQITPGEELPNLKPIPVSINTAGKDVFVDNQSAVTPKVKDQINQLIADIQASTKVFIEQYPSISFKVTNINIASSSSRFRNTNEAADKTWAQLSKERSDAVYEELKARLKEIGIETDDTAVIKRAGYNGDGTSGPNPGKIPVKQTDGSIVMTQAALSRDGTFDNVITDKQEIENSLNLYNKLAKPSDNKDDYDKWKFIIMTCDIVAVVNKIIPVPPTGTANFIMDIKIGTEPGRIKPPRNFEWPEFKFTSTERKAKTKKVMDACPIF